MSFREGILRGGSSLQIADPKDDGEVQTVMSFRELILRGSSLQMEDPKDDCEVL